MEEDEKERMMNWRTRVNNIALNDAASGEYFPERFPADSKERELKEQMHELGKQIARRSDATFTPNAETQRPMKPQEGREE